MLLKLTDPETSKTEEFKCVFKAYVQKPSYRIIMIVHFCNSLNVSKYEVG